MHPNTLLENINDIREETVKSHYAAAVAQLKEKIKLEPLKTLHVINSGCISKDITEEIARRFMKGGVKATVKETVSGFLYKNYTWMIYAEPPIPDYFLDQSNGNIILEI